MKNRPPKADPAKVIPLDLHKRIILDPTYPTDSAAQFMERYHRHRTGTDTLRHHRGAFYRWT